MKRIFTLILLSTFSLGLMAQVEIDPGTFDITISENEQHTFNCNITNGDQNDYQVYWRLVKADDFPTEWSTTVCDANNCFLPNFDECPSNKPNTLSAGGMTLFTVKVDPKGVKGKGGLILELFEDPNFESKIAETDVSGVVTAGMSTNVWDIDQIELSVFPNPTDSHFAIKNDSEVSSIVLSNIIGRKISSVPHQAGKVHEISHLKSGMYLVTMLSSDGKVLKSTRVHKR